MSSRLEVYCSFADEAASLSLINSVMGNGYAVMVTVLTSWKYCGLVMTTAQVASFKAGVGSIASAKWFQCENVEFASRRLVDTSADSNYVDSYWTWRENEAIVLGNAPTLRRDIVYASPTGLNSNLGSLASPVDAVTALTRSPVKAESEIRFLEGTYTISSAINFTADNLKVTTASGKMDARLEFGDGAHLAIRGNSCIWEHLDLAGHYLVRELDEPAFDNPLILDHLPNFSVYGDSVILRHCYIHDFQLIGHWTEANGGLIEECLVQNLGWKGTDGGTGHNWYSQNLATSAMRIMRRCILLPAFGRGVNLFGSNPAVTLGNYTIEDVSQIEDNALYGGSSPITNVNVINNWFLNACFQAGYDEDAANGSLSITDSKIVSMNNPIGMTALNFDNVSFENNLIHSYDFHLEVSTPILITAHGVPSQVAWDDNAHYVAGSAIVYEWGEDSGSYAEFNANALGGGLNAHSSFSSTLPTTNTIEVIACSHWSAIIRIQNLAEQDSVSVDLSSLGLAHGNYRLRACYDYLGDTLEFAYSGSPVSIDMRPAERSQVKPYGYETELATIRKWYGVWVLEAV